MFKINKDSVVYVVCPAFTKTGGTELAHQLVKTLCQNNIKAYITYNGAENVESPLNPAFTEYVDKYKVIMDICDDANNVLIVPEIYFDLVNSFCNIQKAIWWMSVDNYIKNDGFVGACKVNGWEKAIKALISGNIRLRKKGFDKSIVHLYQSEYANHFLKENGITQRYPLSDYVNDSFLENHSNHCDKRRNDVVLYNPKKGYKFTKKLMKKAPDIHWLPLENMSTAEVRKMLSESKVYIDFGNHPGKDRFPREAAIMGCCVITGKRGSAAFYKDIPIDENNKFDEKDNFEAIICRIRSCLEHYEDEYKTYDEYRKMIAGEHVQFDQDVKSVFKVIE